MIWFLTFGEYASGIYSSQVIDVCREISTLSGKKVKLVGLISLRHFFKERQKIKEKYSHSIVLPMFPKLKYYKMNIFSLIFIALTNRPKAIVCRNAIPANLALKLKRIGLVKKVIFDGRAAEYEQLKEYNLVNDVSFTNKFALIEKNAVNKVDYRIAVSEALVNYWQEKYQYTLHQHTVIPCTLNSIHLSNARELPSRDKLGYSKEDIILIYSGSSAKWQSFGILIPFLEEQLINNSNIKVILMVKSNEVAHLFEKKYPEKVRIVWCKEDEVFDYLSVSDYGLLLRESTWTNRVASPVKFAEYLSAGLKVIISPEVGDFSRFTKEQNCGLIYESDYLRLDSVSAERRKVNKSLVLNYFNKKSTFISEKYTELIKNM